MNATKRLILFPQDRGGIGKSFVATFLYYCLIEEGVRVKAFDLDHANSQILETVDRYNDRVGWLVARNLRDGGELPLFGQSNSRKRLLDLEAIEVDVPDMIEITRNRLQSANLMVGRGRTEPGLHLLDRSRCIRYHERMKTELSKAHGLLCG